MTKYREKILYIINSSTCHMTAEQIYIKTKEYYPQIVQATVYNNLKRLVEEGMIAKVSFEGELDRYDRATRHDHLYCVRCGKISDVLLKDLTTGIEKELNIKISSYNLKINYLCSECSKKQKNGG